MYTLAELANIIGAEIIGDREAQISRANSFAAAEPGDLTFAANRNYRNQLHQTRATAVIVAPPAPQTNANLLIVKNPKLAFARAIQILHQQPYVATGISQDFIKGEGCIFGSDLSIHSRVTIGNHVVIGNRVTLHPGVVISDRCRIGDDTIIYANVAIYHDCEIGNRVIIHAGTVIGADGFGFVPDEQGRQVKLLQLARIVIEDDCEIGANCTIDRGGFDETILRRGVKLDNLVQVGHGSQIGENTVVAALAGFSGGTRIGRNCVIAGQVGTNQHITIGDGAVITGQSGVTKDIAAGALIGGMSQDLAGWRRSQVLYSRLPELHERLKRVEKRVEELTEQDEIDEK